MGVARLGAFADYHAEPELRAKLEGWGFTAEDIEEELDNDRRRASVEIEEFAILADGRRIVIDDQRGYSAFPAGGGDPWAHQTRERVVADVLMTLLPDDDAEAEAEDHPWPWLVERLRELGVPTSVEQLRAVPFDVILSERLAARVADATA